MIENKKNYNRENQIFSTVRFISKLVALQNERDIKSLYLHACNVTPLKHTSGNSVGAYSGSKRV